MEKTEGTVERVGGYRVVRRLATGGTSDVLLAKAEGPHGFERSVVLKVLLPQYKHDEDLKRMFAREAAAYARLSHPSIVRLYDFFANGDQLVMVLEYIDGPPLNRLRGMLKAVDQQLDDATALYVAGCIFDALAAAHAATDDTGEAAPVIHRDVNPSNVLVPWDGSVKLADFGVAKVAGMSHQSSLGLIKGTFGYMAPEQVKGEAISPRADVYAGAIILWELLTKRRGFIRGALPEIEVLRELAEPRIVSIDILRPDIDKSVRDAIKRGLEPRAEKRTITAEEMVSVLRAVAPPDEGREKLARALALVRHEPKPSPTSMPPAMPAGPTPSPAGAMGRPMVPRVTPAPRPAVRVPRKTAPYGASPLGGGTGTTPQVPVVGPAQPGTREEMASMALDPTVVAPAAEVTLAGTSPPVRPFGATDSEPPGLATLLEPSPEDAVTSGQGPEVPLFDSLVEPAELVKVTGRESEKLRLEAPLAGVAPGRPLRDAIDDILRDMPSNLPPGVFPKTDPPVGSFVRSEPPTDLGDGLSDAITRKLGQLPAAPAPMASTLSSSAGPATNPMGSSFDTMDRTLALGPGDETLDRPAPQAIHAVTAPMAAVPRQRQGPATMQAFPGWGEMPSAPPGAPSSPPATLPLGAVSPAFHAPPAPRVGPGHSYSATHASAPPPAHPSIPVPGSAPGPRRGNGVAVLGILAVAVVASAAGIAGYLRWQKAHAIVPTSAPSAPAAVPTGSVVASASADRHIAPPASAILLPLASASASVPAQASSAQVPSAQVPSAQAESAQAPSAQASSAPAAPSSSIAAASSSGVRSNEDLPAGMGRVKTTGAAPGRRIYVDDRVVGQTPDAVVVRCGARAIKLGSTGSARTVDVPCGGEINVADR